MISIIDSAGHERFLGNIPVAPPDPSKCRVYGDTPQMPMVPRSQWDAHCPTTPDTTFAYPFLPPAHDQDGVGQCNCDATALAAELARSVQGLPYVRLSGADLYDRINGGSDNGSMLEDALKEMVANGIGTAATSGEVWKRGMKQASAEERAKYKVQEAYLCPTFDHVMSAAIQRRPLISGVMWYSNFNTDADGWCPESGRGQPGGHAVCGFGPAKRGGKYGIAHLNSWLNSGWGYQKKCLCVFPEAWYGNSQVGGWWALGPVTDEGGNAPVPVA